jgi:hypothetical protein
LRHADSESASMLTVILLIAMLIFLHMWLLDVLRREERRCRQRHRRLREQMIDDALRADDAHNGK